MSPQPHALHGLAVDPVETGGTRWTCACGHTGKAADADAAIAGHQQHKSDATYLTRTLAESINPARRRDWFTNNHEGGTR